MKKCASCGHPEIDHEGLSCRSPEGRAFGGCQCRGFEDPDEPEDFFESVARAEVDRILTERPNPKQLWIAWADLPAGEAIPLSGVRLF